MKCSIVSRLLCVIAAMACAITAMAQDFSGAWKGNITAGPYSIPIVLNIQQDEQGLTVTLDSPEQKAFGIKAKGKADGNKINIDVPEIGANYKATLDGNTLDGTYSQMGFSTGLKLTREVAVASATDEDWVNDSLLSVFDNVQLGEVTVTAQRQLIKQEVDRVGYNIEADADSKTNNVLTMLRKVPMVSVDASDEIRVNGQTNFKIFRNGHPDPSLSRNAKDLLKAMPASSVKRIEVITEPGAKYDAEGTTVILNIVMMDNSSIKGVSGMATARANQMGAFGGSLNLTTQLDKVVTSLDYGVYHDRGKSQNSRSRSLSHYGESGAEMMSTGDFDLDKMTFHYGDLSASWEPDTLNLVSLSVGGMAYDYGGDQTSTTTMRDAAAQMLYGYGTDGHTSANSYNLDGRLDYQRRTARKGETITLSYMLSAFRNKNKDKSTYNNVVDMPVPYNGIDQNGTENFNEHTFQLDWTRPFATKHTIETGAKYIYRLNRSHNIINYMGIDSDTDLRFKHVTQVGAAYLSYTFTSGPWSARAGLRYEHSYLRASYPGGDQDAFDAHLNDLVPSASIHYKFNFANSLKLSYAASINRPGINYLNPTRIESPTSVSFGNVDLGSAHTHSLSLTYMRVGPKLTFNITPQFQFSNNGISAVKWADGLVQVSTYANTLKRQTTSLSAFLQWMVLQKTSLMLNGSISYNYYKSKELGLKNDRIGGNFFANLTQYLPWKLQLSAFAGMWGGGVNDLYGHMGTMTFHGLSIQRSFLKEDRLTVQLMAVNPFGGKYTSFTQYTDQGDVTGWSRGEQRQRQFGVSISYRFGSLRTSVKKADKTIENDDLIGGGRQSGNTGTGNGAVGAGGMGN